jgi:hypothetical protein
VQPQLAQAGPQSLAHDAFVSQLYFVHAVVTVGVGWRPQPVDDEHADTRQGKDRFPAPLLDQLRWDHCESGKGPVLSVGLNGSQRDQRLARTTLRNHSTRAGLLPAPDQAHDGESLSRIRFPNFHCEL